MVEKSEIQGSHRIVGLSRNLFQDRAQNDPPPLAALVPTSIDSKLFARKLIRQSALKRDTLRRLQ